MRILFLFFFSVFTFLTQAQVPGFLGKRASVYAGIYLSPTLAQSEGPLPELFNKKYAVGVDYIVGLKSNLSFSYHYHTTPVTDLGFDNAFANHENFRYGLNSHIFSLSFQKYVKKSDYVAPVGTYFSFGLMTAFFTLKDSEENIFPKGTKMARGQVSGVTFGIGKKRVLFRRIIIDAGVEAALMLISPKVDGNTINSDFITASKERVFWSNFLNLKLTAGYIF